VKFSEIIHETFSH